MCRRSLPNAQLIVTLCLEAAIDAAEDLVRLRHVLLPRLERADESEDEQPKDLYERFVNALDESSNDTLPDLKEKTLKVETKELGEILDVALKSMEGIVQNIGNFLPKTQEMEAFMSKLARVSSNAKASEKDCGFGLLKTHSSDI
ncbi:hypothetical protein IGI04_036337 [Brassica rapa subsp. trilocularis]|uniref:Uncharacterized protein n=1 Tax=Brassica rapa subsp. trilocularis TaxID=1813537 RepID=A0ABQ7LF60_BRACM|nr:hypothetical protein IGI04_036337 [Brassica rapa subsp. trilocularis]